MSQKRIKQQQPQQKEVRKTSNVSFGFSYLHDISYPDCKDIGFFIGYLQRLKKLSSVEWNILNGAHRHSFGWEKIPVKSIKKDIKLTDDVDFLISLRATGDNHVFLGFREDNVFQVVFIESKFGDIYNHGQ